MRFVNILPKPVVRLIESFEKLPGIGPKSASRLVFYLLHMPQEELDRFAKHLTELKMQTVLCSICKNVAEEDPCKICADPQRDAAIICVVEQPLDVVSIERTGTYSGAYHVLHGVIDPLNNIGPDEIYIAALLKRINGSVLPVSEIILATNPNMEGEATAMYLTREIKNIHSTVKITRLAHGLPMGADIEYADEVTLSRALAGRNEY